MNISGSQRITYTQEWDVENKLVARMQSEVTNTVTDQVTRFYRDADGNLVKSSQSSVASSQIGSSGLTTSIAGTKHALSEAEGVAELRYLPFGETR